MKRLCAAGLTALIALAGCVGDDARTPDDGAAPPAAAGADHEGSKPSVATAAPAADTAASPDAEIEDAHARRLVDAQAYLDRARADAEERHRRALEACERDAAPGSFDACVATAEESLQAELRSARVEFDARMAPPN